MKKRLITVILVFCLLFSLTPSVLSVGSVYFVGINSTLLPLSDETMPVYIGAQVYVPYTVFSHVSVYGSGLIEDRMLRMYRGGNSARQVDFYVASSRAVGMDNHVYEDVTARIIGGMFYVPLDFICTYFGLRYSIVNCEPAPVVRIKNAADNEILNDRTFAGYYSEQMQRSYNEYFAITEPTSPPTPSGGDDTPDNSPEPPSYENVTLFLSFRGLTSGFAGTVLDTLSPGYSCGFFLTEDDIMQDPGLIRRIAGSGHTIGIWLTNGWYSEYLNASALLFEAAKMKTVLVSSDNAEDVSRMASDNGLVFWNASQIYDENTGTDAGVIKLPTASGSRHHLLLSCTENIAALLPDVLDTIRQGKYSVSRITETVTPVK